MSLQCLRLRHGCRSGDADPAIEAVAGSDPPSRHASIGIEENRDVHRHPPLRRGVAPSQQSRAGRPLSSTAALGDHRFYASGDLAVQLGRGIVRQIVAQRRRATGRVTQLVIVATTGPSRPTSHPVLMTPATINLTATLRARSTAAPFGGIRVASRRTQRQRRSHSMPTPSTPPPESCDPPEAVEVVVGPDGAVGDDRVRHRSPLSAW